MNVSVIAPNQQDNEFSGKIKIINTDSPETDYCEINAILKTPRLKIFSEFFISKLLKTYPNLY